MMSDVIVIGAGIVGISVAHHLSLRGREITIVDVAPQGDKASFGNAGAIAVTEVTPASAPGLIWRVPGWMIDSDGPLSIRPSHLPAMLPWLMRFRAASFARRYESSSRALASLHSRAVPDWEAMLGRAGLAGHLRRTGAITVYETDRGLSKDAEEWSKKRELGVKIERLSGDDSRDLEPALGSRARHGILTPEWSMLSDPKFVVNRLLGHLLARGVTVRQGEVVAIDPHCLGEMGVTCGDGERLRARSVVVAAGVRSTRLAEMMGDPVLIESERGYNVTLPRDSVEIARQIIFGERKFVVSPLATGVRVGGCAEFGGIGSPPRMSRAWRLAQIAKLYLPNLNLDNGQAWSGERPSTPDSLPIIGRSARHMGLFYAFGHGHLGVTQAATTGQLIADLVLDCRPLIDLLPFSPTRFA